MGGKQITDRQTDMIPAHKYILTRPYKLFSQEDSVPDLGYLDLP
jgi:hypothetical protein